MLESVAELATPPQTFPIPTKGTYITFKTGGGTHEAHVSVRSVASVKLSTEPAKVGGHDLHVMRLLGVGGGPVLSLLVAWAEGEGPGSYVRPRFVVLDVPRACRAGSFLFFFASRFGDVGMRVGSDRA